MKTRNIVIWSLVILGVGVGGFILYRKIRTASDSSEKNNRKIRIKVNKKTDEPVDGGEAVETTNDNI